MVVAISVVIIIAVVAVFAISFRPNPTTHRFTIAEGTGAALEQKLTPPNPIPTDLTVKVGDTLEITNNDVVGHSYAFLVLRPGETGRYTFQNPGTFTGACTVGDHEEVTITVRE
jgi:hypothetical protein